MKRITSIIVLVILVISFNGCFLCKKCEIPPEPEIITEYIYIEHEIPEIHEKPEFKEYNLIMVNFNGKDYYLLEENEAAVLSLDWESYKEWCESNFEILKNLK